MYDGNKTDMTEKESKINSQVSGDNYMCFTFYLKEINESSFQQSRWNISWKKAVFGVLVLILVTFFWVGATQFLKRTYNHVTVRPNTTTANGSAPCSDKQFSAPFFSCWFCTGWTSLFFPIYFVIRILSCNKYSSFNNSINYKQLNFSKRAISV